MTEQWFVLRLNAEPWAIGPVSVGRKAGKLFPMVGRNTQLAVFKDAVREELGNQVMLTGKIGIQIFVWRRMDEYKTAQARTARKHEADATNLQKAIEDAIQGVLIHNDRDVQDISTTIVEQSPDVEPMIVIKIYKYDGFDPDRIPLHVWSAIECAPGLVIDPLKTDEFRNTVKNGWGDAVVAVEDVF